MNDDFPFDKSFGLQPDRVQEMAPGVRAIVADNPGPFTYKGTISYIVGRGQVAMIDPGPDDAAHIAALLNAVRGETVTHIFVTHTHRDHSPAAAKVKAATGAKVFAQGPHRPARPLYTGEVRRLDASADLDFRPDIALADSEIVNAAGRGNAGAHRQPHGIRVQRIQPAFCRRPRDGVVDDDRGAARRRDDRIYGITAQARPTQRTALFVGTWRAGARSATLCAAFDPASPSTRRIDFAPACQRRSRYPDHRQGGLYWARSAPCWRRCTLGARAFGRTGRARDRRYRRTAVDRRNLPLGLTAFTGGRLRRRRRGLFLGLRRREHVIDIVDKTAHTLGIGAEIVTAIARDGTYIDSRTVNRRSDTHDDIIAEAEDRRARHRFDYAVAHHACLRGTGVDHPWQRTLRWPRINDAPLASGYHFHGSGKGVLRTYRCLVRLDIRIGRVLLLGRVKTRVGDRIGVARPQTRDGIELRRINRIGGDIIDRRQPRRLDAEIEWIGNQSGADKQCRYGLAAAASAVLPDHNACGESKQDRDASQHQCPSERGKRRNNVQRAGAHDDDSDESRHERKQRDTTRPNGEPRNRCFRE